jgi:hypothetical protein
MTTQLTWGAGKPPCWQCHHFVAMTGGGAAAMCAQGGTVHVRSQPGSGCAFFSADPDRSDATVPATLSFVQAWRRVPKTITRPPEVMALLIPDRRRRTPASDTGAGWRDGEQHKWSRDPERNRRG